MEALGQYVISLTAMVLISSILLSMIKNTAIGTIVRLICGISFITIAISPLVRFKISDFSSIFDVHINFEEAAVRQGIDMMEDDRNMLIRNELEAYILEKASAMDCYIVPEVQLNRDGLPTSVRITGNISEKNRREIVKWITNDLGIPEVDQIWNERSSENSLQDS